MRQWRGQMVGQVITERYLCAIKCIFHLGVCGRTCQARPTLSQLWSFKIRPQKHSCSTWNSPISWSIGFKIAKSSVGTGFGETHTETHKDRDSKGNDKVQYISVMSNKLGRAWNLLLHTRRDICHFLDPRDPFSDLTKPDNLRVLSH